MTGRLFSRTGRPRGERGHVALVLLIGLAVLWLLILCHVHFNASWSDDAWGYLVVPLWAELKLGDRVLFEPPDAVHSPVPYVKTVRGLPGALVAVDPDGTVRVDRVALGRAKARALDGRRLQAIAPGIVPPERYYLHAEHRDSHDSRYAEIGLVPRARILGRAFALPDIPWLGLDGPMVGPEDIRDGGVPAETARKDPEAIREDIVLRDAARKDTVRGDTVTEAGR